MPVDIPPGTTRATFELGWTQNWARFPTNDLDLFLCAPGYVLYRDFSGATINSPEKIVVPNPQEGTWHAVVIGFSVFNGSDTFYLDVTKNVAEQGQPGAPGAGETVRQTVGSSHNPLGHDERLFRGEPCF